MSLSKRFTHRNKVVVAAVATTAALVGGAGVAAAAGGPAAPAPQNGPAVEQAEGTEQPEATEQAEGTEEQEPALNGSIQTQEVPSENEQQEQERLASQATVTETQARDAALIAVPGDVTSSELGDENGSLIWEVDITTADGSSVEVKVDAGSGKVLAQEAGDEDQQEEGEQEDGEQEEATGAATG